MSSLDIFFRKRSSLLFWQKSNFIFVGKKIPPLPNIQKISDFLVFFEKDHLSFSASKKLSYFWEKRNAIFPYDIRKIILQCNIFGKTIFSEHLQNISYFHVFFWEISSFILRLKNSIIFLGKRNIIFHDDTRKIIFQCNFFLKIILSEHLERRKYGFSFSVASFFIWIIYMIIKCYFLINLISQKFFTTTRFNQRFLSFVLDIFGYYLFSPINEIYVYFL